MALINTQQNESYRRTQIDTASPEMLILMLYDGALRFMSQAEEAFDANDREAINHQLLRVQAIIAELLSALDKDKGGEIAVNLERLYIFFLERLGEANMKKTPEPMREIRPLIETLRDTWAEAMKNVVKQQQGPAQPRPRLNLAV